MKSDSGREHRRKRIGICWFWWEMSRELVIEWEEDGPEEGGERKLCKEEVASWFVDLNNLLVYT